MRYLFFPLLVLAIFSMEAQNSEIKRFPVDPENLQIICKGHGSNPGHVIHREASSRNSVANPAVFEVDFSANMPPQAIAAFDYATQILSEALSSTVPIRVLVRWRDLGAGTLAAAGTSEYVKDFPNAPRGIGFPIALAEKIAGLNINGTNDPDIFIDIDDRDDWYFDFENPTSITNSEFDFVSVVLHEMIHGLGFIGFSGFVQDGRGTMKNINFPAGCLEPSCKGPAIYDVFLSRERDTGLCDNFDDPSDEIGNALRSDRLFLTSPNFEDNTFPPRMYAPNPFENGSSIYHLDQAEYRNTVNSLMTPVAARGTIEHSLGLSLDILNDLGWAEDFNGFDDNFAPIITHTPFTSIDDKTTSFTLDAQVVDLFGETDSVYVEYFINGERQPIAILPRNFEDEFRDNLFLGAVELSGALAITDELTYRIVAVDNNDERNIRFDPREGFHSIEIAATSAATITYINDFNARSNDFAGDGFFQNTPSGFSDNAIHSEHPYQNAGLGKTLNFTYQLNIPIQIREDDPLIEFDEIVLVETGEPNTNYTITEFWDFVIVEGRKLEEGGWLPLLDGYDSGAYGPWNTAFQNGQSGTPSLFQPRTIDMTESGHFRAGDEIFVRFRLFSDPFAVGWGWAVDNLRIQDTPVSVEDFIANNDFQLFPNPASNEVITVNATFKKPVTDLELVIYDSFGRLVEQRTVAPSREEIQEVISVAHYPSGMYLVALQINGKEILGKKVIVE